MKHCHLLLLLLVHSLAPTVLTSIQYMTIEVSPFYAAIAPGSSVQIDCIVNTTQKTTTIKWLKFGGEISPDDDKFTLFNNGTLLIAEFSDQDAGSYRCVASNSLGVLRSLEISLELANIATVHERRESRNFLLNQYLELPCTIPESTPAAKVHWYRSSAVVEPDSRIGVTLNGSLVLNYCLEKDKGLWECRVMNSLTNQVQTSVMYLLKNDGSSTDSNTIDAHILHGPINQTAIAGNVVEMQCIAYGRPDPEYTWLKNNNTLMTQPGHTEFSQNSRILTITDVRPDDAGTYSCRVNQQVLDTSHTSSQVSLAVIDPPNILSPGQPLSVAQYASLSLSIDCTATGTLPITWTWWHDAEEVLPDNKERVTIVNTIEENNVRRSLLSIENLKLSDGGVWQCVASDGDTSRSDQISQVVIVNTTQPQVSDDSLRDIFAYVGDNITLPLTCLAYPYPTFSWLRASEAIPLHLERFSLGNSTSPFNGSLTITSVKISDGGNYRCACNNVESTKTSQAILVKIIDKPVLEALPQDVIAAAGSDVTLHCMVTLGAGDVDISYMWTRDFMSLSLDSNKTAAFSNGSLSIKSFNASDVGYYECSVMLESTSNDADPLSYYVGGAFVTQEPPTRPGPPSSLTISEVTSREATILWTEPLHSGGLQIIGYMLEILNLGRHDCTFQDVNLTLTTGANITNHTVTLHPYSQYIARGYSQNSLGYSNVTIETDVFWTQEEAPTMSPLMVTAKQGASVGELMITWEHPPCQERNGLVTNYTIRLTPVGSSSSVNALSTTTSTNTTYVTIKYLYALQEYRVQVSANTRAGHGPFSLEVVAMTGLASVPNVPLNLTIVHLLFDSVHITWQPPKPRVNETINELTTVSHYIIEYNDVQMNLTYTNYSANGLAAGENITFIVSAVNVFGQGEGMTLTIMVPNEPTTTPTSTINVTINATDTSSIEFYQAVWFPMLAGGLAGFVLLCVIITFVMICAISFCCQKNNKARSYTNSRHSAGQGTAHPSFSYPNRKSVLAKMMQVEALETPSPPDDDDDDDDGGLDTSNDSGNGQDSVSMAATSMTHSQSSSTLRSKYQYRSPMEQEEYERLSDVRRNMKVDMIVAKTKSTPPTNSKKKLPNTFKMGSVTVSNGGGSMFLKMAREASPTDTVSSFEYQSRGQLNNGGIHTRSQRLPSYPTDGYTSSEDDSVFHHVSGNREPRVMAPKQFLKPVTRNNSFTVELDPRNMPNLSLMTALPPTPTNGHGNGLPYMPTAIPTSPVETKPPPSVSSKLGSPVRQLSRVPRSRSALKERQHYVINSAEHSTFV